MKIFTGEKPDYVRLDDDVSFQIVRTNPKLTTNTKLMYDGENLYMDAYPAEPILTTNDYTHHRVWRTGLFNRDIRNFLLGTNTAACSIGQEVDDTILLDSFDNQFETMYWCGVESINSDFYPQEMGCIAPLYLRKKRPNYFIIFRIDNPSNINPTIEDNAFDFHYDIEKQAKIVKTFDLREGTPIGDYIKRYVEQRNFKYDQSIYVNFSSNEIYYYGIDRRSGVLTSKVENFDEQLLKNDNTILKMDDWITCGFERNNLIFPYIINLEFLFDDNEIEEYRFARYFGMYCNDIDMYKCKLSDVVSTYYVNVLTNEIIPDTSNSKDIKKETITQVTASLDNNDNIKLSDYHFHYMKDKKDNMYSLTKTLVPGVFDIQGKIDMRDFTGFELSSVSTYAERVSGVGYAMMVFEIEKELETLNEIKIVDKISGNPITTFTAASSLPVGEINGNQFSCRGTIEDTAKALATVIRNCDIEGLKWVYAFSDGNKVIMRSMYPGSHLNNLFDITTDDTTTSAKKINKLTTNYDGGTDKDGCMFKVYASDTNVFFDPEWEDGDPKRYLKCGVGKNNAMIKAIVPYINENNKIDDEYSIIITDENGPYVNVSKTEQVEIIDEFYPIIGILSFFPVRDFDFDNVSSAYGNSAMIDKEIAKFKEESAANEDDEYDEDDEDGEKTIQYARFFNNNGDIVDTEYEYYFENIIPELCTVNKTVPYIAKWGYIDDAKDSCENPYRLNMSKIFETCNFSANTFMQKGDIMEYTHSMPYYVNNTLQVDDSKDLKNQYQYIYVDDALWGDSVDGNDTILNNWTEYFSRKKSAGLGDPFDEMFGDTSTTRYSNKRFNKKYSRFLLGNDVVKSSTLFRGVKFEITEIDKGKEVKTGKYNNYRFSFIYVPVKKDVGGVNKIHFIKNDDYKFIVGIVFFNVKKNLSSDDMDFNKVYVYAGCMGYIDIDNNSESTNNNS